MLILLVALGIFMLVLARKRKKEYRSYGTFVALGIFLLILPLLNFVMMFLAVSMGAIPG